MNQLMLKKFATLVKDAGGTAYMIGGAVRDRFLGISSKDVDVEVHGIEPDVLRGILGKFGTVCEVGKSFGVFHVCGIDFSLPRRDNKVGVGHKGFDCTVDIHMGTKEAARRRDLTINSIMVNIIDGETVDHYGGIKDIGDKILRAVDPETFVEDPLRVLRVMQFAARFCFTVDPETVEICKSIDLSELPMERVGGEFEKMMLMGVEPSRGIRFLDEIGALRYFPEILSLKGCKQNPAYHPEGDVFEHTMQTIDAAARIRQSVDKDNRFVYMFSALCHDFGKPISTFTELDGRIICTGHESEGDLPTRTFMWRITRNVNLTEEIVNLVRNHMAPFNFYDGRAKSPAIRRLAKRVNIPLVCQLSRADKRGRGNPNAECPEADWLEERHCKLNLPEVGGEKPILMGRHLISMCMKPGIEFGKILKEVYEKQLDGEIVDLDSAVEYVSKNYMAQKV